MANKMEQLTSCFANMCIYCLPKMLTWKFNLISYDGYYRYVGKRVLSQSQICHITHTRMLKLFHVSLAAYGHIIRTLVSLCYALQVSGDQIACTVAITIAIAMSWINEKKCFFLLTHSLSHLIWLE